MTVAVPGMDYSEFAGIGTEDVDASEFGITRWKIDHNDGLFVNNQNDFGYEAIDVVLLNIVKQRVFFPKETSEENVDPLCKSNNHVDGFPGEDFPWDQYAFGYQEELPLACKSCNFAQWGPRNAAGKSSPPPCKELFTFTFISLNEEMDQTPGLISVKGTSIGPAKKYLSTFIQRRWPLFVQSTRISLTPNMYMGRKYYVAKFEALETQDPSNFADFANIALSARTYLTAPPQSALDKLAIAAELETGEYAAHTPVEEVAEPTPEPVVKTEPMPVERPKTAPVATPRPRPSSPTPAAPASVSRPVSAPAAATSRPAPARPASVARPTPTRPAARPNPSDVDAITEAPEVIKGSVVEDDDELPFDMLSALC